MNWFWMECLFMLKINGENQSPSVAYENGVCLCLWAVACGCFNAFAHSWIARKMNVSVHLIKFATLLSIENLYSIRFEEFTMSWKKRSTWGANIAFCNSLFGCAFGTTPWEFDWNKFPFCTHGKSHCNC